MLLTFGQEHIKNEVAAKLDGKQCFIHQKPAVVQEIIQSESSNNRATRCSAYLLIQTVQKFGLENKYDNNWPVQEALKARLKYTSGWEKKKVERKVNAEIKQVRPIC